ncbi:MAG TPA: BlaI/MecI/CopY family transcriptional regulator [Caulobacteraceae bacterium]|jgi:predicted transcriptional regulator
MPTITEAESVVMEALWRSEPPLAAEQIAVEVATTHSWSLATVKTLLNRLLNKDAITAELDRRRYLYRPKVARADYVLAESQSLVNRLFSGRLAPLVSHFSQAQQLTPEDLAELKRLIQELDP